MGNWAVTYKYLPNPKTTDNVLHVQFLENVPKENIDYLIRHLNRHREYIEILKIQNLRAYDKQCLKEKDYFKIPCSKYSNKFKCEEFMLGRDCANCCEFAIIEKQGE